MNGFVDIFTCNVFAWKKCTHWVQCFVVMLCDETN